tara:strand:- start:50 stop:646 length:597 start_codon:yes stop_codon:yes gene_type:complete
MESVVTSAGIPLQEGLTLVVVGEREEGLVLEKGPRYIVPVNTKMEIVKQAIRDEDLPWELRLKIALDVAKAMEYMHGLVPPLCHCDLRSPNICITSLDLSAEVHAKVMDFGLTEAMPIPAKKRLMTWQWLAPEVIAGSDVPVNVQSYDERSDVYSFGIVLYEIVSRKCPFLDDYWEKFCTRDGLSWRSPFACRSTGLE